MSFSVQVGLLLALATALASVLGFLLKHRGAVEAPPIELRAPLRSTKALLSSGWFVAGLVVATGSWGLHVSALALAPISLVQSVIAGGLVLLTVIADRVFHLPVTRREWVGVGLTAAGLAFLAATLEGTGDNAHSHYGTPTLLIYVGVLTVLSFAVIPLARREGMAGTALALSAGLQWGASDITIKALSGHLDNDGIGVLLSPLALIILLLSLVGLVISARSLQVGDAVPVIAVTSASANLVTIAAGPIVFREPLPDSTLGLIVRFIAFGLVVSAAALTPPPLPKEGSPA